MYGRKTEPAILCTVNLLAILSGGDFYWEMFFDGLWTDQIFIYTSFIHLHYV